MVVGITTPLGGYGSGSESAEFQQFLDRISAPDTTHKDAYRSLIDGLVADGNPWTKADAIYAVKCADSTTMLQNLKSSSFTISVVGSPVFTADVGIVGANGGYLNTNFNPTSGTPNYAQNSCAMFGRTSTAFSSGVSYGAMGGQSGAARVNVFPHFSDNVYYYLPQTDNGDTATTGQPGAFYGWTRTGSASNAQVGYIDGNSSTNNGSSATSGALVSANMLMLEDLFSGDRHFTANLELFWIGGGLTGTEVDNLRTRFATFHSAF